MHANDAKINLLPSGLVRTVFRSPAQNMESSTAHICALHWWQVSRLMKAQLTSCAIFKLYHGHFICLTIQIHTQVSLEFISGLCHYKCPVESAEIIFACHHSSKLAVLINVLGYIHFLSACFFGSVAQDTNPLAVWYKHPTLYSFQIRILTNSVFWMYFEGFCWFSQVTWESWSVCFQGLA